MAPSGRLERSRGRHEFTRLFPPVAAAAVLVTSLAACSGPGIGDCVETRGRDQIRKVDCSSTRATYRLIAVDVGDKVRKSGDVPGTDAFYPVWSTRGWSYSLCLAHNGFRRRQKPRGEGN